MYQQQKERRIEQSLLLSPDAENAGTLNPVHDAIVISDIHLGSPSCQAESLATFLYAILQGRLLTKQLILNGDVFDSIDFRRLKKAHWKILSLLRKLSDTVAITWVSGNHDGPTELISDLLGVAVRKEYVVSSRGKSILILHGDIFDDFIDAHPQITWFADLLYRFLQRVDKSHRIARKAKHGSKIFLRCTETLRLRAVEYARRRFMDVVCCGHTHHAEAVTSGRIGYFNSGCWTETHCTFLSINGGEVSLRYFEEGMFVENGRSPVPSVLLENLAMTRN